MWLVLGTKETTERVPNGKQVERRCSECGEISMFYERRATSTIQLYFIDVVDYRSRVVMACGACNALYATDDLGAAEPDALTRVSDAAGQVGGAIASGATRAVDRLASAARSAFRVEAPRAEPPRTEPGGTPDPLADDAADLEARFQELEARVRVRVDK